MTEFYQHLHYIKMRVNAISRQPYGQFSLVYPDKCYILKPTIQLRYDLAFGQVGFPGIHHEDILGEKYTMTGVLPWLIKEIFF